MPHYDCGSATHQPPIKQYVGLGRVFTRLARVPSAYLPGKENGKELPYLSLLFVLPTATILEFLLTSLLF